METNTILGFSFMLMAYLLGSFSSAITLSKIMRFPDPRSQGSNNPGATNVMRIAGKKAAALTLLGDLLKGLVSVLFAAQFLHSPVFIALTGLSAFLGHCYPVYYQFKGGKGVATAFGFILAFNWVTGLITAIIWLIVAKVFKISSLAALIAFTFLPLIYFALYNELTISAILAVMTLIMAIRHRKNIQRILRGQEN